MIEFRNVFVKYVNEFYSLYNFSCEINSHTLFVGDFFDGATAIMRTLAKIDRDYKGEIFIDDVNLKNIKDKDLNLVYLPEKPVLFKNKNIFKNLYFPLKIRKINKNTAKNLIYRIFSEFKNENFNFLNNSLYVKNNELINNKNTNNNNSDCSQMENILKLKVNKLSFDEQKIIALIRSILRKPKYILLENFFENLDEDYFPFAKFLLNKLKENSTIIACEKDKTNLKYFKDFEIIILNKDKEKKEE